MPRPSKKAAEEKAAVLAPTRVIDVNNFIRVSKSVYERLDTIQGLINSFRIDFVRQTTLLYGEPIDGFPGVDTLVNLESVAATLPTSVPEAVPAVEEKKERKKRTHDPNAPKRPLTPYFLYMQTARPIIANDLGDAAPKGAVQEEGQRRWASMGAAEKQGWNQAYQYNLRLYQARVHSYKAGNALAKNMGDEEASKYADEFGIPLPTVGAGEDAGNDQDAIAEQLQGTSADAPGEDDDAPPTKTPKKAAAGRKRKTATPGDDAEVPKSAATPASPDKKRRRSTKAAEEKEEPKKSGRKKGKSG